MHNSIYTIKTERALSKLGAETQKNKLLPPNSICVSCIGTAGLVSLTSEISQTNQQINSIIPQKNISPYYIYLLMLTKNEIINKLGQSGSTIVNLNKTQFERISVLIPSDEVLNNFHELLKPIFTSILKNMKENEKLSNIRDNLLPKLISGKLDIKNCHI